MGLEAAFDYIDHLNVANPGDTDDVDEGDDHLRGIKNALKANVIGSNTYTSLKVAGAAMLTARAVGVDILASAPPALDDNTNALNIGTLAGAHLAFGPAAIQGKASATTAAALAINSLGGNVSIGPQSGTGVVSMYVSGAAMLNLRAAGADLLATVAPDLVDNGNALNIGTLAGAHLAFGPAAIQGKASAVAAAALAINSLGGDVNVGPQSGSGRVNLFDNGNGVVARTRDGGFSIIGDATDTIIDFYSDDGLTQEGYFQHVHSTGLMEFRNLVHGGTFRAVGEDTGGTARVLFEGISDGAFVAYYNGGAAFYTLSNGAQLRDPTGDLPRLFMLDSASANRFFVGRSSGGWSGIIGYTHGEEVRLAAEDAGGTLRNLLIADPDSDVKLHHAGTEMIRTAALGNDQTTAGSIRHYDNSFYELGLAPAPFSSTAANITLQRSNASKFNRLTAGTQVSITAANTDLVSDGTMFLVHNATGGNISLVPSSVALNWVDGAGGATGTRTLADEGIATIYKAGDGVYYVWGVGLS